MTDIERLLIRIGRGAPLAYRALSAEERAWRGRYLLMVAAVGASPTFAWANALAPVVNDSTTDIRAIVRAVPDEVLIDQIHRTGVRIEDLLPYDEEPAG